MTVRRELETELRAAEVTLADTERHCVTSGLGLGHSSLARARLAVLLATMALALAGCDAIAAAVLQATGSALVPL